VYGYLSGDGAEHVALVLDPTTAAVADGRTPLVRVHSECLTGDVLGSVRCDCGDQLAAALAEIARYGWGAVIYLRGHEGRGIGLHAKLRAYALQDSGLDTVEANLALGLPVDAREYRAAAEILQDLGLARIRLLSGNPAKIAQLTEHGIEVVSRHSPAVPARPENSAYLATKRTRMGHDDPGRLVPVWEELLAGRVPDRAAAGAEVELLDRYAGLVQAGPEVAIAQLAQSADGFIASRTGDARFVSGPEDRQHLHRLRALVDAVVVGAGTVAADDPRLTVRAVAGTSPTRVVLDPYARIPRDSLVLTDGAADTIWFVGTATQLSGAVAGRVRVVPLPLGADGFDPRAVLAALRALGLGRVLVEGGGRTVSRFLAAGALDQLWLTTAAVLIGDGVPGLRFAGADRLADAIRVPTQRFALGSDLCTVFDLRAGRVPGGKDQEVGVVDPDEELARG
jgi:3,4-dihydroxy 2-butanone 4-phosphate synthase/GTP cyclohydrolase II